MIPKYKDIVELLKKGSTLEAQEKIMELREAVVELQDENSELKASISELETKLEFNSSLTFQSPFYYAEGDDVPYCPRCWEVDKNAVHFPNPFVSAAGPVYNCAECEASIIYPRNR